MDDPKPEDTTGKTMLENVAPTPSATPHLPATSDDQPGGDEIIESTSVQGAPDDE